MQNTAVNCIEHLWNRLEVSKHAKSKHFAVLLSHLDTRC